MAGQPHELKPGSCWMARNFKKRIFLARLLGKVSLLTLLAVLLANHFAAAAPPQPAKKVLLLYFYQAVLPANARQVSLPVV